MNDNIIYTDGSCVKNGTKESKGGYGIYFKKSIFGNDIKINRKGDMVKLHIDNNLEVFYITNIRMEGMAIITTMFLYAEKYVFKKDINKNNIIEYLNKNFHKIESYNKLNYNSKDLKYDVDENYSFEIITDSLFWINVIEKWINGWISKKILLQKKNPDLLLILYYYIILFKENNIKMKLSHVRSHQVNNRNHHSDHNDIADVLATTSMKNINNEFYLQN